MTLNLLDQFVLSQLSAFLFIFCRVGTALMVMPGFGDSYVSPRIRLLFGLAMSVLLTPLLVDKMPALPSSTLALGILIIGEVIIGFFIGFIGRTILSVLHVAGTIIAFQSSLAVSSIFDPVTGAQTAVLSNFMTVVAMTIIFALNLHHLMLAAVVESYTLFTPGEYAVTEDVFRYYLRLMADCFALGVMLAAPHIVFSFAFYLMGGLMTRLMPNFQVFYVAMSPQIVLAFLLMFAILMVVMEVFVEFTEDRLGAFAGAF
ncbi:MAG: flagellar biosynthetic protein FliR [Rickettsiales bacterium]|nr:flagellar biosynthetic protein FliR [Rickettsiales bacterium]